MRVEWAGETANKGRSRSTSIHTALWKHDELTGWPASSVRECERSSERAEGDESVTHGLAALAAVARVREPCLAMFVAAERAAIVPSESRVKKRDERSEGIAANRRNGNRTASTGVPRLPTARAARGNVAKTSANTAEAIDSERGKVYGWDPARKRCRAQSSIALQSIRARVSHPSQQKEEGRKSAPGDGLVRLPALLSPTPHPPPSPLHVANPPRNPHRRKVLERPAERDVGEDDEQQLEVEFVRERNELEERENRRRGRHEEGVKREG